MVILEVAAGIFMGFGLLLSVVALFNTLGVKQSFWAGMCVFVVSLFFGLMTMGFVSLESKHQVVVVPEPVSEEVETVNRKAAQFALEQRILDQASCFTWAMLDMNFRLEDIQIMLNTVYALDANEHLGMLDINKVFRQAEQTKAEWRLNRQRPNSEPKTCSPVELFKKNKSLQRGLGLTDEKRTRQWAKSFRRATAWVFTVEGLHFVGVDVTKWWPDKWTVSSIKVSSITSHPLEDYLDDK